MYQRRRRRVQPCGPPGAGRGVRRSGGAAPTYGAV